MQQMVDRYIHNHSRLAGISADLRRKAETITLKDRPKKRQYGRNKATWTGADERYYLARFFELEHKHGREIATLQRKLMRQKQAIEALVAKHKLNDAPRLKEAPIIHPGFDLRR